MVRRYRRLTTVARSEKVAPVAASGPTKRVPRGRPTSAVRPSRRARSAGGESEVNSGMPVPASQPRLIRPTKTTATHASRTRQGMDLAVEAEGVRAAARFLKADVDALRPVRVDFHFHKIFVWIRGELTSEELDVLRANSAYAEVLKQGDWHYAKGKPIYQLNNPAFTHRVELKSARPLAFDCLTKHGENSVTVAELTVDCSYYDDVERLKTHRAFDVGFVQPWQRNNDRRSWVENDGTSTGRRRGMYHTWYSDRASPGAGDHDPETGEVWACFHMEGRVNTGTKLKHLGIANAADAANFDHEAFWRERFKLWVVDFERLGRHHLNKAAGKKRRGAHPKGGYNGKSYDWHTGRVLWRANAYDHSGMLSVQTFLKNYGRGPFLRAVSVEHLLGAGKQPMSIAK